jgi:hypothetical protein
MFFKIVGRISAIETIASGKGIRENRRLRKLYGGRKWKKLKGNAMVQPADGIRCVMLSCWYEAHGISAKEFKIKRILEIQ